MRCLHSPMRISKNAGVGNVEFLKGEIENIPLPDNSVDVAHFKLRYQPFG